MATVGDAAASNDRMAALVALRDRLARALDASESGRDIAALSRQLTLVLAEIDELAPPEKAGDVIDDIARRRAARRSSGSAHSPRTAVQN